MSKLFQAGKQASKASQPTSKQPTNQPKQSNGRAPRAPNQNKRRGKQGFGDKPDAPRRPSSRTARANGQSASPVPRSEKPSNRACADKTSQYFRCAEPTRVRAKMSVKKYQVETCRARGGYAALVVSGVNSVYRVNPSQVESRQLKSRQFKSSEFKSSQVESCQFKSSPSGVKVKLSSRVKLPRVESSYVAQCKPSKVKSSQGESIQAKSSLVQSISVRSSRFHPSQGEQGCNDSLQG